MGPSCGCNHGTFLWLQLLPITPIPHKLKNVRLRCMLNGRYGPWRLHGLRLSKKREVYIVRCSEGTPTKSNWRYNNWWGTVGSRNYETKTMWRHIQRWLICPTSRKSRLGMIRIESLPNMCAAQCATYTAFDTAYHVCLFRIGVRKFDDSCPDHQVRLLPHCYWWFSCVVYIDGSHHGTVQQVDN